MSLKFVILFVVICFAIPAKSARILGLFPDPSWSHVFIYTSITNALIERGHDVTVVTNVPINKKNLTFRHIQLDIEDFPKDFMKQVVKKRLVYKRYLALSELLPRYANASLNQPVMRKMMEEESFDLVILGYFLNDFLLGVAAHFKCPVVVSFMLQTHRLTNVFVGNPSEIAYVPTFVMKNRQPLDFWGRVKNFLFTAVLEEILISLIADRTQERYYNANFPPDKYPSFSDMKKNVSLVLTNHHFSQTPIRPNVPALIEIGGIQIKDKPDPLPEDLQKILDNSSKHGAIYFSLGSNIQGHHLDAAKAKILFDVLSKLPQTILWKWGDSDYPGQSPNIIYKSWLPQDDILAHPNVKLFITHGGQGSVVESQYHGVPMVGIPLFGEQSTNMENVQKEGFGLAVDYLTLSEEGFSNAVHEVLTNPKYSENVKRFAKLYKDRPMTAKETAVFWVEYVLRHHGAPHMQSPAVHLNAFQLLSLDVIGFLLAVVYVAWKVIKVTFLLIFRRKSRKGKSKKE